MQTNESGVITGFMRNHEIINLNKKKKEYNIACFKTTNANL